MQFIFDRFDAKNGDQLPPLFSMGRGAHRGARFWFGFPLNTEAHVNEKEALIAALRRAADLLEEGAGCPSSVMFVVDGTPTRPIPHERFIRIERTIHHKGWQFLHNVLAHPMLAIYRPWGLRLHEWTAKGMYGDDSDEYMTADPTDIGG